MSPNVRSQQRLLYSSMAKSYQATCLSADSQSLYRALEHDQEDNERQAQFSEIQSGAPTIHRCQLLITQSIVGNNEGSRAGHVDCSVVVSFLGPFFEAITLARPVGIRTSSL